MRSLGDLRRELAFAGGILRRRPFQALVQVTNRCNMRCSFCDFWPNGAKPEEELSVGDFEKLASQMGELGTFFVSIEGGEPTLRPELPEIVRAFSRRHLAALYTNGWKVDAPYARALFDAGLTQVGVSIDYPDAARHDAKRGLDGAFASAVAAAERLRDAAPHGGRQVHLMTVLMRSNQDDLEPLLALSRDLGVGHSFTLLAKGGDRRGEGPDEWPDRPVSARLLELWSRFPQLRMFREYLAGIDPFLAEAPGGLTLLRPPGAPGELPRCRAGSTGFNVDHLGNLSPCIEKLGRPVGNVRQEPLRSLVERLRERDDAAGCQACWTACRGFSQALAEGSSPSALLELGTRMRSA